MKVKIKTTENTSKFAWYAPCTGMEFEVEPLNNGHYKVKGHTFHSIKSTECEVIEPPYSQRQSDWLNEMNLKVGDKVKVLRKSTDKEGGWPNFWDAKMNQFVGMVCEIKAISLQNIALWNTDKSDWFCFPYFVLEPHKELTYVERQANWLNETWLKVGDKVKVIRAAESYENGWQNLWTKDMTSSVNEVLVITDIKGKNGIRLSGRHTFNYPYFVLEPYKEEPKPKQEYKAIPEFYPNPQIIGFHTNWDIQKHPKIEELIHAIPGVERPLHTFLMHHYDFSVSIGKLFDRKEIAEKVLAVLDDYFKSK